MEVHSIEELARVVDENFAGYPDYYKGLWKNPEEKPSHFMMLDNKLIFLEQSRTDFKLSEAFSYPIYGTSFSTPLFVRKYLAS